MPTEEQPRGAKRTDSSFSFRKRKRPATVNGRAAYLDPCGESVMLKHSLIALFAGGALAAGTPVSGKPSYEPIYITDGQYTATLQQHSHRWLLQPLRGDEVDITDHSKACGSAAPMPKGLWYVSQD